MAWGAGARNSSARSRNVNYHEDEGNRVSGSGGSAGGSGGDFNGLGKVVIGGIFLYCLGSAGLGWVGDIITNVTDVVSSKIEAVEDKKLQKKYKKYEKKDKKASKKSAKKMDKKRNEQGYVEEYDIEEVELAEELDIEAEDIKDLLEYVEEYVLGDNRSGVYIPSENVVYIDSEVFDDTAKYKAAVLDRLQYYDDNVTFVSTFHKYGLSYEDEYTKASFIVESTLDDNISPLNYVIFDGNVGMPDKKDLTVMITYTPINPDSIFRTDELYLVE